MRGIKSEATAEAFDYLAEHARQDELLARVEREAAGMPHPAMQITPDQGALLTLLAQLVHARDALELGTFTGYSAICIARGLAPGGRLTCLELEPEYAANARGNLEAAGVADRVDVVVGPALRWLERIPEEPRFDFVFLDADKESYPHYYELLLPRMRPNALLLLDNTLLGGRVLDPADARAETLAPEDWRALWERLER